MNPPHQFINGQHFQADKYESVFAALTLLFSRDQTWESCGPPNRRRYRKLRGLEASRADVSGGDVRVGEALTLLRKCVDVFHSEEMFLYLSNLTGESRLFWGGLSVSSDKRSQSGMGDKFFSGTTLRRPLIEEGYTFCSGS